MSDFAIEKLMPTGIPDFKITNTVNTGEFNLHKATSLIDFYNQNLSFDNSSVLSIFDAVLPDFSKTNIQSNLRPHKNTNSDNLTISLPDVQQNQVFKVTSNPIKEIRDKKFLENLPEEIKNKVLERKLLTLKDANDKALSYNNIVYFSDLSDEQWNNVLKRKLLSVKNADDTILTGAETSKLAKLTDEQWNNVIKRNLFSLKFSNDNPMNAFDVSELSKLSDEQWNNVSKRKLISFKTKNISMLTASGICEFAKLSDTQWKNLNKRNILSIDEIAENCDFTVLDIAGRLADLSDEEWEHSDKKERILKELNNLTQEDEDIKPSILYNLKGQDLEKTNELIYGKKSPEVTKMLDDFKKEYPDIELIVNNNVTAEKAKEIIDLVKEYVDNHQSTGTPFAKRIMVTNMRGCEGFYAVPEPGDTIHISIHQPIDLMRTTLVHENGHFRDLLDYSYDDKDIPENIAEILKKILWDYSLKNNQETIAVLTEAIETPDNVDKYNPLTEILHVRKDDNNNYYLMLPKICNVSEEELNKLGEFLRDIHCPEIIPDYEENKHGEITSYNQTIIREQQTPLNIAKYIAAQIGIEETTLMNRIKDRKLLTAKNSDNEMLCGVEIMCLAKLTDAEWANISARKLSTIKNAEGKLFDNFDIIDLAKLSDEQWNKVQERKLLTLKDDDSKALSGEDISTYANLSDEEWNKKRKKYDMFIIVR